MPVVVVKNECDNYQEGLFLYSLKKGILPSRKRRDCTSKFKIRAMRDYLRANFGEKAHFIKYVGYNADEADRLNNAQNNDNPAYETLRYPLAGPWYKSPIKIYGFHRAMEAIYLEAHGLPPVSKSGCFFCPFTRQAGWIWLYHNHRDLYDLAQFLEDHSDDMKKGWFLTSITKEFLGRGIGSLMALRIRIERGDFKDKITVDDRGRMHCERDLGTK